MGYSINLLTLLALVLAIGLVVDDAIVVVENIYRHIEDGMTPFEAALQGAREIAGPVIAMTITLAAVYAPIGFVTGVTGALFREFAFTLAGAVVVSGVIALTLSPMMCSMLLKPPARADGGFARLLDRMFDALAPALRAPAAPTLNFRAMTVLVLVGVLALTAIMYMSTPKELAPEEDQGVLFPLVKTPQYANLDYLEQTTDKLYKVLDADPREEPRLRHQRLGRRASGLRRRDAEAVGSAQAHSESRCCRNCSRSSPTSPARRCSPSRRRRCPARPAARRCSSSSASTGDYQQLADVLDKMQTAAQKSGLFIFTDSDLKFDTPQIEFKIDADKANRLGIKMADIGDSLATLLGGNYVNRFNLYGRSYEVIPQVPRDFRLTRGLADAISGAHRRAGELVPLSTVASVSKTVQPNALTNFQQLNSATLSGRAVPRPHARRGASNSCRRRRRRSSPQGYTYDFQGECRQYRAGGQHACR